MGDFFNDPLFFALTLLFGVLLLRQAAWLVVSRSGPAVLRSHRRLSSSALWARALPLRETLKARFPRLFAWLAARLDPKEFSGLPLTLLVLAIAYTSFLIGVIVGKVGDAEAAGKRSDTGKMKAKGNTLRRLARFAYNWIKGIPSSIPSKK